MAEAGDGYQVASVGGPRPVSCCLLATLQTGSRDKQYCRGRRWINHYPFRIVPSALCKHSWPCGTASERCFVTVGCKKTFASRNRKQKPLVPQRDSIVFG